MWAKSVRLEWSDKCRHCQNEAETLEHLIFDTCLQLEHKFELESKFGIISVQDLMAALMSSNPARPSLEEHMLERTRANRLFARRVFDVG